MQGRLQGVPNARRRKFSKVKVESEEEAYSREFFRKDKMENKAEEEVDWKFLGVLFVNLTYEFPIS
jgi:hypothetical protein